MIILITSLTIYLNKRDAFLKYLAPMLDASQAEEGCLEYTVSEMLTRPNTFQFTEFWQDKAALQDHEGSAHLATFRAQIGDFIEERTPKQVFEVSVLDDS